MIVCLIFLMLLVIIRHPHLILPSYSLFIIPSTFFLLIMVLIYYYYYYYA